jgi:predicted O-methyltransferase YrrM
MPMPVPRVSHIEEQDPKFFVFRRDTYIRWAVWAIFAVIASFLLGNYGVALALIVLGYLILSTLLQIYHKLEAEQVRHYWQTEALFSLYSTLRIAHPLPPMRLWAASPDFVILAVSLIREHRPRVALEIGSGASTIISAYALKEVGEGILISLEHDKSFAETTAANLVSHGMNHVASVHFAPLKLVKVGSAEKLWYDISVLENFPDSIDLLVVDGPPSGTGTLARYPALPLLYDRLSPGAYVLVDDFMRDDEYTMVNLWLDQFRLNVIRSYANEKGAVILQKPPSENNRAP